MSDHDQFRELIQGYALGALDARERAAVETHLAAGCSECSKALEEARWLVSQLAYLAPGAEPSEMLKDRLLQTVRTEGGGVAPGAGNLRAAVPWWIWAGGAGLLAKIPVDLARPLPGDPYVLRLSDRKRAEASESAGQVTSDL